MKYDSPKINPTLIAQLTAMPMEDFSLLVAQVINIKEKEERERQQRKIKQATAQLNSAVDTLLENEDPMQVVEMLHILHNKALDIACAKNK